MLDSPRVFYPGHDRPFRLDGDQLSYLHGPSNIEIEANVEGGDSSALPYRVHSHREVNIDTVQKPSTRD